MLRKEIDMKRNTKSLMVSRLIVMGAVVVLMAVGFTSIVFAGSTPEQNKQIVVSFYNMGLRDHQPKEAAERFIGKQYIQHNPLVPDGKEAFVEFFVPFIKNNPDASWVIKRVIAEGDLVVLHVHSKMNKEDRGVAIIDIFRVEKGKIVEHWDVLQPIPEKSANNNTMF
jgi:predicted SnoaL-like aldol condensation-catalyzing enzyme